MNSVAVKPAEFAYTPFKEGFLVGYGKDEEEMHEGSKLYYGKGEKVVVVRNELTEPLETFPYVLFLKDLKKLEDSRFPWPYHELNGQTAARRTLTGGLRLRRKSGQLINGFRRTATFSRQDYKTIRRFL
ncbi:MAG: hypothetical protein J4469_03655 [Candidatus Aenigmarchaeota archaeon]|nr:hypothetical protein [Candidatus Aenigmarchaeota archaeon]